jgi:glycolate oxidase iron-sulfur subunit
MVKDYGRLLAGDGAYATRAERVSRATRDLAEIVEPDDLRRARREGGSGPRVAWQSPCTLQHGQRVAGRVEALLEAAGCTLTPTSEATLCCGSAGTYSILQPALSGELLKRKIAALTGSGPEVIATANIGCLEHLRAESPVPVRHWIEIVADSIARQN